MRSLSLRVFSAMVLSASLGSSSYFNAQTAAADGALKLNQIQVIGTHNSYHAGLR
ncbi:hypothetical protein [Tunturiibacter gelidiferens]|uniref:Uncharacterized protein n=1 Tax=Tunturiibacter gelidiferens TaxID=3069689 RepID=A0AAU7Z1Q3_9BACT